MKRQIKQFGWLKEHRDRRDLKFAKSEAFRGIIIKPRPFPLTVDLRSFMPPVYYQGHLGSCVGNAAAALFDVARFKQKLSFMSPSRLFIYYNARDVQGWAEWDTGCYIRDAIKSLNSLGVCPENEWAYDVSQFATKPPEKDYTDALASQTIVYRSLDNDLMQMKFCLASTYPFIFGFPVYKSFNFQSVWDTGIIPMPLPDDEIIGGHSMLTLGYDDHTQNFLVRNSWGDNWGMGGYGWMPFNFMLNYASDLWTISLVEKGI